MAKSVFASLLKKLGFSQIEEFTLGWVISEEGGPTRAFTVRPGPRPWGYTWLPCFFRFGGAVKMTVVIDEKKKIWMALKDVALEVYRFENAGFGTIVEEETEDGDL